MAKTPILGTAYTARAGDLASQRMVNLFLESVDTKSGTEPAALYGCPGLKFALTLGPGPIRALRLINQTVYVVSGNAVFSVAAGFIATQIGTLLTSTGPVYVVNNATQTGFFDSYQPYCWSGGTFAAIVLPFTGTVGTPAYQDGFVLLNQPGTFKIWQSNANDMKTWDPLRFTTEDGNAQHVEGLVAFHDQIYVFKTFSFCVYVNAGLPGFSFQRLEGVYPTTGLAAPASLTVVSDHLFWVGQNSSGQARVFVTNAYEPEELSTYAIDFAINGYSTASDCVGFGYIQEGHVFYIANFPSGNQTWVADYKESKKLGVGCWHERASFAQGAFGVYGVQCAIQYGDLIYAGDSVSGNIYVLDMDTYTDNGSPRKWLRSWRATPQAMYATEKVNWLNMEMETGLGVDPNAHPQLVLRQSFDGGHSWSAEMYQSAGQTGELANDIRFTRLGATRRGLNSDRTFELSSTDPFKVAILGAETG